MAGVEYPAAIEGSQNDKETGIGENAAQQKTRSEPAWAAAGAALLHAILALFLQAIVFRFLFGS